jgi:hypothetical protein
LKHKIKKKTLSTCEKISFFSPIGEKCKVRKLDIKIAKNDENVL